MDIIYRSILILHVISGFLALVCGAITLISAKGSKVHRRTGKIFFYSMLVVPVTAVTLCVIKPNQFLLFIGLFSFYLNYAGYRAIQNKSLKPSLTDWVVLVLASVNIIFMLTSMNLVVMIFGGIGAFAASRQWITSIKASKGTELPEKAWLAMHIGMMMGAYTATLTAFLVVNYQLFSLIGFPAWFVWLLPSLILSPLSYYWTVKFTGKGSSKLKQAGVQP